MPIWIAVFHSMNLWLSLHWLLSPKCLSSLSIFFAFSLLQFCQLLYVGFCPAAVSESLDFWLFLTIHHTLGLFFLLESYGLFQTLILWGRGGTMLMQRSSEDLLCNTLLGLLFLLGLWIWCQLMYFDTGFLF